jgi:hypothetical protein
MPAAPTSSSGRTSITSAEPSASRAKKSGTCRRALGWFAHARQNGCDDTAMTSGSKSSSITASRSTQDSKPTCPPVVANHHEPWKLRWPWNDPNDRTGKTCSKPTFHSTSSAPLGFAPASPTKTTCTPVAGNSALALTPTTTDPHQPMRQP